MKREREREGERKKGEREKVSDRNKEKLNSTLGSIGMLCIYQKIRILSSHHLYL